MFGVVLAFRLRRHVRDVQLMILMHLSIARLVVVHRMIVGARIVDLRDLEQASILKIQSVGIATTVRFDVLKRLPQEVRSTTEIEQRPTLLFGLHPTLNQSHVVY